MKLRKEGVISGLGRMKRGTRADGKEKESEEKEGRRSICPGQKLYRKNKAHSLYLRSFQGSGVLYRRKDTEGGGGRGVLEEKKKLNGKEGGYCLLTLPLIQQAELLSAATTLPPLKGNGEELSPLREARKKRTGVKASQGQKPFGFGRRGPGGT